LVRSIWKLPNTSKHIIRNLLVVKRRKFFKKNQFLVFNKACTIVQPFMGLVARVYKGNLFRKLQINQYIVGYKYGSFTHTRKPFTYPIKKKKDNFMGLKSLPIFNKVGTYDYWEDSWSSCYNYKHYYFKIFFLKKIIIEVLSGVFFNQVFFKNFYEIGVINYYKQKNINLLKCFYFTRIWCLKYHRWLIFLTYYFNLSGLLKIKKPINIILSKVSTKSYIHTSIKLYCINKNKGYKKTHYF